MACHFVRVEDFNRVFRISDSGIDELVNGEFIKPVSSIFGGDLMEGTPLSEVEVANLIKSSKENAVKIDKLKAAADRIAEHMQSWRAENGYRTYTEDELNALKAVILDDGMVNNGLAPPEPEETRIAREANIAACSSIAADVAAAEYGITVGRIFTEDEGNRTTIAARSIFAYLLRNLCEYATLRTITDMMPAHPYNESLRLIRRVEKQMRNDAAYKEKIENMLVETAKQIGSETNDGNE